MALVTSLSRLLELILEVVAGLILVALTSIVVYAVVARTLGNSPTWYDEVASILLAWLTYYGSALVALKRGHIGFDGLLMAMPPRLRMAAAVFSEILVIGFFVILAWTGMQVLIVLEGMTLISLTWVPVQLTQSVIPIGATLFVIAELLTMPAYFAKLRSGVSLEREEIEHAIEEAEKTIGGDAEAILTGTPARPASQPEKAAP